MRRTAVRCPQPAVRSALRHEPRRPGSPRSPSRQPADPGLPRPVWLRGPTESRRRQAAPARSPALPVRPPARLQGWARASCPGPCSSGVAGADGCPGIGTDTGASVCSTLWRCGRRGGWRSGRRGCRGGCRRDGRSSRLRRRSGRRSGRSGRLRGRRNGHRRGHCGTHRGRFPDPQVRVENIVGGKRLVGRKLQVLRHAVGRIEPPLARRQRLVLERPKVMPSPERLGLVRGVFRPRTRPIDGTFAAGRPPNG